MSSALNLQPFAFRQMTDAEFDAFRPLFERLTGIQLMPTKKAMLSGRLAKRLRALSLDSYGEYFRRIDDDGDPLERQIALDLVTTNETHFFREIGHFDLLRGELLQPRPVHTLRIWSAACSSGEEVYSIAMTLADMLGVNGNWEVVGSDLSTRMLEAAQRGLYPIQLSSELPEVHLKRICLEGTDDYQDTFLIDRSLRRYVHFFHINLIQKLPDLGLFDVVFLRNVMIYFDAATKQKVVEAVISKLRPGGWLIVGHAESLLNPPPVLTAVWPTVYRKAVK